MILSWPLFSKIFENAFPGQNLVFLFKCAYANQRIRPNVIYDIWMISRIGAGLNVQKRHSVRAFVKQRHDGKKNKLVLVLEVHLHMQYKIQGKGNTCLTNLLAFDLPKSLARKSAKTRDYYLMILVNTCQLTRLKASLRSLVAWSTVSA